MREREKNSKSTIYLHQQRENGLRVYVLVHSTCHLSKCLCLLSIREWENLARSIESSQSCRKQTRSTSIRYSCFVSNSNPQLARGNNRSTLTLRLGIANGHQMKYIDDNRRDNRKIKCISKPTIHYFIHSIARIILFISRLSSSRAHDNVTATATNCNNSNKLLTWRINFIWISKTESFYLASKQRTTYIPGILSFYLQWLTSRSES